jgi:hypothetical protein
MASIRKAKKQLNKTMRQGCNMHIVSAGVNGKFIYYVNGQKIHPRLVYLLPHVKAAKPESYKLKPYKTISDEFGDWLFAEIDLKS